MRTPTLTRPAGGAVAGRPRVRPPPRRPADVNHRRALAPAATPASAPPDVAANPVTLMAWLVEEAGLPPPAAEPTVDGRLVAARAVAAGEVG